MEKKIDRKHLLKGGAVGTLALGVLGAGASSAAARNDDDDDKNDNDDKGERGGLQVHVHGNLQGYGATSSSARLAVSFDVFGRAGSLAGAGWDGGTGTDPTGLVPGGLWPRGPVGACYYTASGSLEDGTLTLVGRSLFTNRPAGPPPPTAPNLTDTEEPGRSDTRADGRDFNATVNVKTGEVINWSLSPQGATFKSDPANPALVMVSHGGRTRP